MNLKVYAWSDEVQFVPELGLNREKALNDVCGSRNHRQKGGKKRMKNKLLAEAVVLATLVATMFLVGFAQAGHYTPSATRNGAGGGFVTASNDIYFNDQTYVINVPASSVYTNYGISAGSTSLQERRTSLNTVNSEAYIRSDFFPTGNPNYGMYAWAWTYPAYTQQPFGGGSNWWLI